MAHKCPSGIKLRHNNFLYDIVIFIQTKTTLLRALIKVFRSVFPLLHRSKQKLLNIHLLKDCKDCKIVIVNVTVSRFNIISEISQGLQHGICYLKQKILGKKALK